MLFVLYTLNPSEYALILCCALHFSDPGCAQRVHAQLRKLLCLCMCMVCNVSFSTASGLGRHEQATGHGGRGLPPLPITRVHTRKRFTFRQKRDYLLSVRSVAETECGGDMHHARKLVSARTGVKPKRL